MSPAKAKPKRKPGRPPGRADVQAVPIYLPREEHAALVSRSDLTGQAMTTIVRRGLALLRKREGW